ncbi:MarR family winged helix-turn-helix transcriptional regulator [Variovorax guangxiensis]|uniref:MarR family winged helix-turn-helix transcriptional regulator n=1 Tax=Variovorax guangxiensis TaxID=1775474 RepID=UPI002856586C|nr:MarR family winged helix-turn-helix transcriptional regulator [Variovorax guangxiensis]MDR6858654.1 DNA-binding MarR family transcriptional regulator [Variovorax guangxiensis]
MTTITKTSRALIKSRDPKLEVPVASQPLSVERIRRKSDASRKAREGNKHLYFIGVAEARYVLRKVFRIVEEQAKKFGIDPLAHQALIQIYGSPDMELQVNQIASRLDITPAFSSSLVKMLVEKGLVARRRGDQDQRTTYVAMTDLGRDTLHKIDENVKFHVDYFVSQLSTEERESALSILMFYVGAKL